MKVLMVHNFYQQPGGEDQSFSLEASLLEEKGHLVTRYTRDNDEIEAISQLRLAKGAIWNDESYRTLRDLLRKQRYQVVHFQNTFPLVSPAGYYAAHDAGVAVVQSLRNYRLACVNGLFYRDGRVCEDCLGKALPWPGIAHACYRGSRVASGVVATMLGYHRMRGTYQKRVDAYIALTKFSRAKFVEMGLPIDAISVKPNFVSPDPGVGSGSGGYALFVGRLSEEKGVRTLLEAWKISGARLPLKIVGDGPLASSVKEAAERLPGIEWLGRKSPGEVYRLMGDAKLLIFPSAWYETFGRVAVEAFAKGTPVVASKIGAIAELVEHGHTGLHFEAGSAKDLALQIGWALDHPRELAQMRFAARSEYEAKYTSEINYRSLLEIYRLAIEKSAARRLGPGNDGS